MVNIFKKDRNGTVTNVILADAVDVMRQLLEQLGSRGLIMAAHDVLEKAADPTTPEGSEGMLAYHSTSALASLLEEVHGVNDVERFRMEEDLGSLVNDPDAVADWRRRNCG